MNRVRPWLYIGKYRETLNRRLLAVNQIEAMLQLAESVQQPGITSLYLPVEDFQPLRPDLLRQGVDFVRAEKGEGRRVLVACGAGINRSTAFTVAVLKEEERLSLLDAFRLVKHRHPPAMPHPPVWLSLCDYYGEDVPFEMLFDLEM
ncbi:MAG: dual specificity protein phosphatase family protein [Chloroflexota bacterium]